MKKAIFFCLILMFGFGCKKDKGSKEGQVDVYLLKSFTASVDQSTGVGITTINNAVLEDVPLVSNQDISYYSSATNTFTLKKDISSVIRNYGADKAFAVTVDNQPVYYGKFHPMYLSYMVVGVATVSTLVMNGNELKIDFITITGNNTQQQLDKRNDQKIKDALKSTNRFR